MINVALLGNPNVGKTTVFNALTGANQYVGNWPGVTIEKKAGKLGQDISIVDLPGIYAMDTFSNEEKVAKNFLLNDNVDVIINVVDASNLSRNLYLTNQLKEFKKPIVLILNMIDVAESKGIKVDCDKLSKELNVSVVPIIAKKKNGIEKIESTIKRASNEIVEYDYKEKSEVEVYKDIEKVLEISVKLTTSKKTLSEKIDSIILNPILSYPIFIGLMLLLFKFTFDWVGGPLQGLTEELVDAYIATPMDSLLANSSDWFRSLILDGIIGGIGGTLPFFPLVVSLFFGISLFEDSGYMSRTAFLMDNIMRKVGLSGKAFIPMMLGNGCASPAIMATRTLESEKDRKITALISPLMTCGAKLPIYALFVSIFFPKNEAIVTASLYLLGIVVAILVASVLNKTSFNKDIEPFILELPEYKLPTIGGLLRNTWNKSKGFLYKVITMMFAMSVILWALSSFNGSGYTDDMNSSFLAMLGHIISPIFAPIGMGNWKISVAILSGLGAKEVVVNTLGVLFGNTTSVLPTVFTGVTAYAFLVFSALYTPCIAALATMKKEYGNKMMMISLSYQFVVAWVAAFVVNIAGIFFGESISMMNLIVGAIVIVILAVLVIAKLKSSSEIDNSTEKLKQVG